MDEKIEISRRTVIAGIVATAAAPLLASNALAEPSTKAVKKRAPAIAGATGVPRYLHSAVTMANGLILITGGYHVNEVARQGRFAPASTSVQIYDPWKQAWSNAASMRQPRARHASVLLGDGRVAVIGGYHYDGLDSVEIYDPATNTWSRGNPLPQPMYDHTACLAQGRVVIMGGPNGSPGFEFEPIVTALRATP